ncbi:MAG: hypothetical protein IJK28_00650 [Clostridia bacterium]|nr:hypothetical protein [Clostridia bacterium]
MFTLYGLLSEGFPAFGAKCGELGKRIGSGDWTPLITIVIDVLLIVGLILVMRRKEARRKFKVALKRKPQNVPLVCTVLAFMVYSFNLSNITRTINDIQGGLIAQAGFATMLLSILVIVCCMNAFPYRKKANVPMMAVMFVMMVILLVCDFYFHAWIVDATTRAKDTRAWTPAMRSAAFSVMMHAVITMLAGALAACVPLLRKWFKRFNTAVELEVNEEMSAIDISGE